MSVFTAARRYPWTAIAEAPLMRMIAYGASNRIRFRCHGR
jgi:hypothetical protein